MPYFWMCYRNLDHRVGVVIIKAPSLFEAGLDAGLGGLDAGGSFVEAIEIGAELIALALPEQIGRMLSEEEAENLVVRFEGRRPARARRKRKPKKP
jgi:hypothetical protein